MWYSARASGPVTTLKMRSWRIMLTPYTVPVICSVLGVTDCNEGGRPRQPVKERPPNWTKSRTFKLMVVLDLQRAPTTESQPRPLSTAPLTPYVPP